MKKIICFITLAALAVPFLAGCGKEQTTQVDSSAIQVDSSGKKKGGGAENDKGLYK